MKFPKPRNKVINVLADELFQSYLWGYRTAEQKETPLDEETFKRKIKANMKKGAKRKVVVVARFTFGWG